MRTAISRRELCLLAASAALTGVSGGCRRRDRPGLSEVPDGVVLEPGKYADLCPRWSPDGKRVAFLRATTDRRYQLFAADASLGNAQALLEPMLINPDRPLRSGRGFYVDGEGISWSPDGKRIAFPRTEWFDFEDGERLPGTGLWAYDEPGRKVVPLAIHPPKYEQEFYYYRSLRWSPDGQRFAAVGEAPDGGTTLLVRDLRRLDPKDESVRPDAYDDADWPVWSPDGKRLVFRQGILRAATADAIETLRVIMPGGKEAGRICALTPIDYGRMTEADARTPHFPAPRFSAPTWSPDGTRIAFAVTPDASDRTLYAIYVTDARSERAPLRVSPQDGRGYHAPVWIDGARVGAIRTAGNGWEVVELRTTGTQRSRLVGRIPTDDFDWSPDRKYIVCAKAKKIGPQPAGVPPSVLVVKTHV